MNPLVTTEWLAAELGKDDLRVVDATYFLPSDGRDARAEFETSHIPGAVFFDLKEISDAASPLPNMLPSPEKFAGSMQSLGIGDGGRIIVYDNSPNHSAARAWWMLLVYGAKDVAILDGGFTRWKSENRQVESGMPAALPRPFTASMDRTGVRELSQMRQNLETDAEQVLDARPAARFSGSEPEFRPGLRSGHIPGSRNLPHARLFNADGTWKQGEELRKAFTDAGIDLDKGVVTTCGSGVSAAVLSFGLALLGKTDVALYDGSWSEWGGQSDTPVATGAA